MKRGLLTTKRKKESYNLRELPNLLSCGLSSVVTNTCKGLIPNIKGKNESLVYFKHILIDGLKYRL
jgi:hypothetical protein